MTAYVVKGWCRSCQAKTVQNRTTQEDPATRQPVESTVCTECGGQVGQVAQVSQAEIASRGAS